jgi:membrane protease YdiL (CAAX protease family)
MDSIRATHAAAALATVRRARRGLLLFAIVLAPLSLLGYWFYRVSKASGPPLMPDLPLMASPALAAVITRLLLREGFADVSFRFGGRRGVHALVLGVAVPLIVGSLAYGTAYLTGLAQFAPPALPLLAPAAGPVTNFAITLALAATLGTLILLPLAAGEEIGWRGYVLPRLIDAGVARPVLLSALVWGAWHLVPLLGSGYADLPSPLFSATNLVITAAAFGSILAWMRLGTGSIWPCVVAHAAWNAIINSAFNLATQGEDATFWIGESGFLVMLALVGVTLVIGRTRCREIIPGLGADAELDTML